MNEILQILQYLSKNTYDSMVSIRLSNNNVIFQFDWKDDYHYRWAISAEEIKYADFEIAKYVASKARHQYEAK